jgi:hypothetical protein
MGDAGNLRPRRLAEATEKQSLLFIELIWEIKMTIFRSELNGKSPFS